MNDFINDFVGASASRLVRLCEHGEAKAHDVGQHTSASGRCSGGQFLLSDARVVEAKVLRQAVFDAVMSYFGMHEEDTDDQLEASEITDRIMADALPYDKT